MPAGLHNARDFVRSIGSPVASLWTAIRARGVFRGGILLGKTAGRPNDDGAEGRVVVGKRGRGWQIICPESSVLSSAALTLSSIPSFLDISSMPKREKQGQVRAADPNLN